MGIKERQLKPFLTASEESLKYYLAVINISMELQILHENEKPKQEEVIVRRPPVEDPPVLKQIKTKARQYGFTEFAIEYGATSVTLCVPWKKVNGRYHLIKDRLDIGIDLLRELEEDDSGSSDGFIEIGVPHEGGHANVPKNRQNKQVPYSGDEIMNRQKDKGMNVYGRKAIAPQESQANIYATVEDNRHKTLDETKMDIAGFLWYTSWGYDNTPIYDAVCFSLSRFVPIDRLKHFGSTIKKRTPNFLRKYVLSRSANSYATDFFPWLKKEARKEIVGMALDIDNEYCAGRLERAKK